LFLVLGIFSPAGWVGCYFGYKQWQVAKTQLAQADLQKQQPQESPSPQPSRDVAAMTTLIVLCFISSTTSVGSLVFAFYCSRRVRRLRLENDSLSQLLTKYDAASSKLKIHSAFYGTGPLDDVDVVERLRHYKPSGLIILVDNNTLGCDPAPNRPKRLRVAYSYLNDATWEIYRPEYSRLVLPEDKEFIERTAAEYERECDRKIAEYSEALKIEQARQAKSFLEIQDLKNNPKRLLGAVVDGRKQIEVVGVLKEYAKQAERLKELLEKVWHLYNNDRTADPLLYPLALSTMPDEIKEWRHKELWRFRSLYREHLNALQATVPEVRTDLILLGFPCDVPYLEVRKGLENHVRFLGEEADQRLRSFLGAKVEI